MATSHSLAPRLQLGRAVRERFLAEAEAALVTLGAQVLDRLTALADEKSPFPIATQMAALSLGKPGIAQKGMLTNASGQAGDAWKAMGYADLVQAFERGLQQQASFADINTDSVDLSRLRDRGRCSRPPARPTSSSRQASASASSIGS